MWDGYNAFYGRHGDTAVAADVSAVTWQRFFDPSEPVHVLLAQSNGNVCGLAHCILHGSTTQIAPVCYLRDLFTAESARGQGIGRALIDGVSALARSLGATQVYWQTHQSNATAMRLYDQVAQRAPFVIYGKSL